MSLQIPAERTRREQGRKVVDNSNEDTHGRNMTNKPKTEWIDPDDAPELPDDAWDRAQISVAGKVIRPARGTHTRWFTEEELAARRAAEELD
jgi:hypothetical protein